MNLTAIQDFFTRAKVLATSALTWLTVISAVLVVIAQQLNEVGGAPEWLTRNLARAIAVIGVVILQVRRVTPVADEDKGLLPPKGPAVEVVPNEPVGDKGEVGLAMVFLLLALILFLVVGAIGAGWITSEYIMAFLGFGLASWVLASLVP